MGTPKKQDPETVFQWNGIPRPGQLIPLGLQHVVAAVVGIITPAILVSNTCGLSEAEKTLMIQVSLILTALATLLQLFPIFRRIGSGLPFIMGISFVRNLILPRSWAQRSSAASLPSYSASLSSGSVPFSRPWSPVR